MQTINNYTDAYLMEKTEKNLFLSIKMKKEIKYTHLEDALKVKNDNQHLKGKIIINNKTGEQRMILFLFIKKISWIWDNTEEIKGYDVWVVYSGISNGINLATSLNEFEKKFTIKQK